MRSRNACSGEPRRTRPLRRIEGDRASRRLVRCAPVARRVCATPRIRSTVKSLSCLCSACRFSRRDAWLIARLSAPPISTRITSSSRWTAGSSTSSSRSTEVSRIWSPSASCPIWPWAISTPSDTSPNAAACRAIPSKRTRRTWSSPWRRRSIGSRTTSTSTAASPAGSTTRSPTCSCSPSSPSAAPTSRASARISPSAP